MNALNNVKLGTKLVGGFITVAALMVVIAVVGFLNMKSINDKMTSMFKDRLLPIEQLGNVNTNIYRLRGNVYKFILLPEESAAVEADMNLAIAEINKNITLYSERMLLPEEKEELARFQAAWGVYQKEVADVMTNLKVGNKEVALKSMATGGATANARAAIDASIAKLLEINVNFANRLNQEGIRTFTTASVTSAIVGFLAIFLAVLTGIVLTRSITGPMSRGVLMMQEMSRGHLNTRLKMDRKDEVGVLARTMDEFADDLQNNVIGTMKKIAAGNLDDNLTPKDAQDEIAPALKATIDSINGLVAETGTLTQAAVDGRLDVRGNPAKFGGDYARIVQGVNNTLDAVIGPLNVAAEYVDRISKGDIPARITDTYHGDFNEIKNNLNQLIDSINGLVAETGTLTQAAVDGRLDTRGNPAKFGGDYARIIQGVNNTLDAVIGPLNVAAEYVDRISKGDIPMKITDTYHGDFNEIKNNLNQCIDGLGGLLESNAVLQQMAVNDYTRKVTGKYQGIFAEVAQATDEVRDRLLHIQNTALNVANGDLADLPLYKQLGNGQGRRSENDQIAPALIKMMEAIQNMSQEAYTLTKAAIEGKLDTRADASKHQGEYRIIIQGINNTLDAVIGPLNVAAEYVDRISKGDIPARITDTYNGDFNEIKNNLNQCIDAIGTMVDQVGVVIQAGRDGHLAKRADADKTQGVYRKILRGVNDTLDAVIGPLNVSAEYVDRISKGDIPAKITDAYHGDFNEIKNNLNQLIDSFNEVTTLTTRIAAGDLNVTVRPRSSQDELMKSLSAMLNYLQEMAAAANRLAAGNLNISISPKSKEDVLGNAFAQMIVNLQQVIGDIVQISQMLAEGDLRVKPEAEYLGDFVQIKTGLETALAGLNKTMQQTTLVVTQVGDSVEEVRTIGQDVASNSEEQSSAAEEVAASLQETDSQVKANAENAGVANQLVNNTALAADSGQKKMKLMTEAMGAIAQSSRMIGNIIKVIDEIAFQTNLLALNAAVEAARAGQHGRGFAVVAQEVRNLAGRSAKAAKETAELIEDSGRRVEEGVRITGETAASLGEIVQNVVKVKDLVAEIAAASEEQSRGIAQIGSAMMQVSQGAQSSSRQSEELAGSADELAGLAEQLSQEVSRFKLLEQENSRGVAKPSRKIPYGSGKPPAKSGKTTTRSFDRDERGYEGF